MRVFYIFRFSVFFRGISGVFEKITPFFIRKIEKYPVKNNRFKLFNVLRSKDIDEGIDLANVYENWYEKICNSFIKFGSKTYNNALCEGINNKIEAIKRSSFGILNFSHLRARVFFLLEI